MSAPLSFRDARGQRPMFRAPDPEAPPMTQAHLRLMVVMLLFVALTALIALRLVQLTVFGGGDAANGAQALPPRGRIVDRNGMPLATTIDSWTIAVNPQTVLGDRNALAAKLAVLLPEKSEAQYRRILWDRHRKFVYLAQRALPSLVAQVHALGEPAIMELRKPERLYPQASLAGHVLGYAQIVDNPRTHKAELTGIGVERFLDPQLAQGRTVQLSLDARVQAALESEIARRMAETSAVGGAGVVLDVDNGEILALASLPTINPNVPLRVQADIPNKATLLTYELGSTFKMLTFANAIESGVITDWTQRWDVAAPLHVGGFTIHDDEPQHRALTTPEVMTYSSNIGTARIADALGADRVRAFFDKVGFGRRLDLQIRELGQPQQPRYWARTAVMTTAYGHGIAVTPLHLAEVYAGLANGGVMHPATLLKRQPGEAVPGRRIITEATSARIRQLMRLVVLQGTGTNADAPGLRVGGKTGTAEKVVGHGYAKNANVTVFAGAFPMDRPRYVILTMLDDAKAGKATFGFKTAGWMTAPIGKRLIKRIGPLLGVQPEEGHDVDEEALLAQLAEKKVPGKNAIE